MQSLYSGLLFASGRFWRCLRKKAWREGQDVCIYIFLLADLTFSFILPLAAHFHLTIYDNRRLSAVVWNISEWFQHWICNEGKAQATQIALCFKRIEYYMSNNCSCVVCMWTRCYEFASVIKRKLIVVCHNMWSRCFSGEVLKNKTDQNSCPSSLDSRSCPHVCIV